MATLISAFAISILPASPFHMPMPRMIKTVHKTVHKVMPRYHADRCPKSFTLSYGRRIARGIFRGHSELSQRVYPRVRHLEICQQSRTHQRKLRRFVGWEYWHHKKRVLAHIQKASPVEVSAPSEPVTTTSSGIASYYDLTGTTSCGQPDAQVGYSFASLFLPCGTQVEMCAERCVTATMDDHGPYVAGRIFDLNVALKDALGCPDLCDVRYKVL